jgi:hypothetical protein
MMSFIAYDVSFELWTNDDPPRLVTSDVLSQAAGKELRVMNYLDGAAVQVGTATIDEHGQIVAKITEDIPQLKRHVYSDVSIRKDQFEDPGVFGWRDIFPIAKSQEPLAHFKVDKDGKFKQLVDFDNNHKKEN